MSLETMLRTPAPLGRAAPIRRRDAETNELGDPERVDLLGLPFARLTQPGLVDEIERMIDAGGCHWIVTANVQHVSMAARDATFRGTLCSADLVAADGAPICWVSGQRAGGERLERVTGADLVRPLARRCAERGWRLLLVGGDEGVAAEVGRRLEEENPGLALCMPFAPRFPDGRLDGEHTDAAIARIRAERPDVLLLALGTPKQELWLAHCLERLGVPVSVGVGAAFDFLAGRQRRAPVWMQRAGIEWVHRVVREPRRLGPRYLRNGVTFVRLAALELLLHRDT
jgi:N-acetylglucosaminyldiphosphoundecaprenol N-acetyl-beta-D-mannosaminyltransferase